MCWLFKTTLQISSPITVVVLIVLAFVPIEANVKGSLKMWLPVIIFFATFVATGLVLLLYFGRTGRIETPKSKYDKLQSTLNVCETKISSLETKYISLEAKIDELTELLKKQK